MSANEDDGLPPEGFWEGMAEQKRQRERLVGHWSFVDITANELADAGIGNDVATATSFAISSIQRHALNRNAIRLSLHDRDRLLDLAIKAQGPILSMIQDRRGASCLPFAASAIDAVCALIVMWSEEEPWNIRPDELRSDVHKRALWLRQEAYNAALETQYRQKKSDRALRIVSDLQTEALERRHG